jgi:hypothetical protein
MTPNKYIMKIYIFHDNLVIPIDIMNIGDLFYKASQI